MSKLIVATYNLAQITRNSLLHEIEKALEGRETFIDTDKSINEKIYNGDVFSNIKGDGIILTNKAKEQLDELVVACHEFVYIQIIE